MVLNNYSQGPSKLPMVTGQLGIVVQQYLEYLSHFRL